MDQIHCILLKMQNGASLSDLFRIAREIIFGFDEDVLKRTRSSLTEIPARTDRPGCGVTLLMKQPNAMPYMWAAALIAVAIWGAVGSPQMAHTSARQHYAGTR